MGAHQLIHGVGELELTIEDPDYEGSVEILYPNISVHPEVENNLTFKVAKTSGGATDVPGDGIITDGIYEFPVDIPVVGIVGVWFESGASLDIPENWNVEETKLTLRCWSESEEASIITFKDFSMLASWGKIQYLPIMGIG